MEIEKPITSEYYSPPENIISAEMAKRFGLSIIRSSHFSEDNDELCRELIRQLREARNNFSLLEKRSLEQQNALMKSTFDNLFQTIENFELC